MGLHFRHIFQPMASALPSIEFNPLNTQSFEIYFAKTGFCQLWNMQQENIYSVFMSIYMSYDLFTTNAVNDQNHPFSLLLGGFFCRSFSQLIFIHLLCLSLFCLVCFPALQKESSIASFITRRTILNFPPRIYGHQFSYRFRIFSDYHLYIFFRTIIYFFLSIFRGVLFVKYTQEFNRLMNQLQKL